MQVEGSEGDRCVFAITFQGTQICLGRTWEEVVATVDSVQFDAKVAASLKLCLYERLKERLKIHPHQEKKLLDEYA
jgi:hypothetical protein